jgi:hypothetical protein
MRLKQLCNPTAQLAIVTAGVSHVIGTLVCSQFQSRIENVNLARQLIAHQAKIMRY